MTSNDTFDGGCTCRHVRYRLTSRPMWVNACHCTWCQRETGAAFATNALIEADRVELTGAGAPEAVDTPSAEGGEDDKWLRTRRRHGDSREMDADLGGQL